MYWNIHEVCYNQSRDVMEKRKIRVYTKLDNVEENNEFLAIKDDNLIKYIDLENNTMIINMEDNVIIRENNDYLYNIDFNSNEITITMKRLNKIFKKDIKTIVISKSLTKYLVRYMLIDENIINEYYVKFWNICCIIL